MNKAQKQLLSHIQVTDVDVSFPEHSIESPTCQMAYAYSPPIVTFKLKWKKMGYAEFKEIRDELGILDIDPTLLTMLHQMTIGQKTQEPPAGVCP